jgi:hypothetical protein
VALSRSRNVAAVVLVVALAFGAGSSVVLAPETAAFVPVTTLTVVDGAVFISHGGAGFTLAREGDVLAAGDTIRTGTGSAEITYFEGSSVRVEGDAEIVVESLRTSSDAPQALVRVWHVITALVSGSSRYEMRGPGSTASVRG